ncbi:cytochrome P450 [Amycolatopsis rhabdoformis]|uniref:Cytochrome P450 n=1 Tax=Amycolatopsis rhabdoformis TaxID=1448059 RepID=A0ABZ1HZR2_9PSEU|nr:cytochrome P450 [Amycolatopsis rhabdoformis]WSE27645.1 cytochrome P450 [Amycolatopsis rhabdoformis]
MTTLLARQAPTAPGDLPLLGHTLSLLRPDRVGYLTSLQPVGDLVRIRIGTHPFLVLNSPELVRTVMVEEAKSFDRGRIFQKARPYVGEGLFTAEGTEHLRQRRMVQPAFHREQIQRSIRIMNDVVRKQAATWRPGATVAMDREMHVLASEIIGQCMFLAPEAREVVQLARDELPALLQGLGQRTLLPDFLARVPTPVGRRFDAACADLRAAAARLVTVYRENHGDLGDFVSLLLGAHDARTGTTLTDTQIRDQIMTLLIAGIETPATLMTWAMYELARDPALRARLEAEVDEVVGDRDIEAADLPALTLTEAFVDENLRLHHPLWILMRRAVKPVTLGGVTIEPGSEVLYSPAALQRDPTIFPDPLRFNPDRWLGDAPTDRMRRAFMPYGLGNRQCIGDAFSGVQMKITIAGIVAARRLDLPAGFRPKTVISSIVHLDRLPMTVHQRGNQ